jgi:hypothetical protein
MVGRCYRDVEEWGGGGIGESVFWTGCSFGAWGEVSGYRFGGGVGI